MSYLPSLEEHRIAKLTAVGYTYLNHRTHTGKTLEDHSLLIVGHKEHLKSIMDLWDGYLVVNLGTDNKLINGDGALELFKTRSALMKRHSIAEHWSKNGKGRVIYFIPVSDENPEAPVELGVPKAPNIHMIPEVAWFLADSLLSYPELTLPKRTE